MSQKRLNRIKYGEWTIWVLIITILIGLFYHSMILKNLRNQIIESILLIVCLVSMIFIRMLKHRLKLIKGLLKAYGEKIGFNSILLINIGIGAIWIILGFLTYNDSNAFVFNLTVGIIWIIAGFSKISRYYIQITDRSIIKLDLDFIKINAIELITFSPDKIILKTAKRTMEIFYADLKSDEKKSIINDFEEIKLKNNLA
jgi:hypothetical protein